MSPSKYATVGGTFASETPSFRMRTDMFLSDEGPTATLERLDFTFVIYRQYTNFNFCVLICN